ncbi:hypothetical protein D6817_02720 [Candidatus Pacearchaeota archaeon]|nr:MAG: hypothetical protein D6817_02720 [Candidatus Pacearchaeota archaeon]
MKRITREDVENLRKSFESRGYGKVDADVAGRKFSYYVLPQDLNSKLPDFAMRCTSDDGSAYVIGVSDSLPESYRPYVALHEFVEFVEIGAQVPGRCARALEVELNSVPEEIRKSYAERRRDFFKNLVNYYENEIKDGKRAVSEADLAEFKRSLEMLEKFVSKACD